ncbi:helix-turn-helix domain-containing protein [Streptomyces sp. NPDC054962]
MEDWAEIRRLHRAEQTPVRAIARKLGIARNTVRRAIADDAPPKYQRPSLRSVTPSYAVTRRSHGVAARKSRSWSTPGLTGRGSGSP